MTTMTISIPESTRAFVEAQTRREGFASVDEYLASVLDQVGVREARRRLDALLLEGIESGPAEPVTPEDWDAIRREGLAILEAERRVP